MIPILYEYNETSFTNNGLHRLIDIISCAVVEERNGIYECDFEYPVNGQYFEEIKCGRIIGVKHDNSSDIQPFDIVSFSKPIEGIVSFHAVHISYRLKGYVVQDTDINSLSDALTALASATPSNLFTYSADFTANGYAAAFNDVPRSVRQLLGGIEGSILDTYGGEYEWDKFNVILHQHRGQTVDFAVRYGYNMLNYKDETDYSESYTTAIPYWIGTDADGVEKIVVGNKVNSGLTPYNNMEKCIALDLSEAFETEPTTAELETLALNKMTGNHVNNPHQSIDVDFIRLQDYSEYSGYDELLQCKLCDSIKVIFPDYQTSENFKIVRTEYDVLREKFITMQLGTLSTTLAEALGVNSSTGYVGSPGGGGGTTNYNDLTNKPSINSVTLSGNKTTSDLLIHDIPTGGSTGQVLTKNSGTNYDVKWSTPSSGGVTDVKINNTSVVTSNVANIPKATNSTWGVVKVQYGNPEGSNTYQGVIYRDSDTVRFPTLNGSYEIDPIVIPSATTTKKGAMSAADKTKLDGIDLMTGASSSADGTGGLVPQPTTGQQDYTLFGDGTWDEIKYTRYLQSSNITFSVDRRNALYQIGSIVIPAATTTDIGLMTASDKLKLNQLAVFPVGTVYESTSSNFNPSKVFSGTWAALGTSEVTSADTMITSDSDNIVTSEGDTLGFGIVTYKFEKTA